MKVALYKGVRDVVLEDRPMLTAGPGEAIVKVEYVGICGTDVHSYMHEGIISPPTVFGHETVGTVYQLGAGVTSCMVGDRVAVGPPGNCGECHNCLQGRASICVNGFLRTTGISPMTDGGYAEYLLVRDPKKMLLPIPRNVSFEEAVLFDVLGTSFHGIRKSNFKLGDTVLVIGTGPIGISAIMLLKLGGAGKLIVATLGEEKRKLGLQYGADASFDVSKEGAGLADKVRELTDGKGADITFDCAGGSAAVNTAIDATRSGGQIVLIGVDGKPTSFVTARVVPHELELTTSFVYDAAEVGMIFDFLASGKLPLARTMVTDIIGMGDVVEKGLERLSKDNDQTKILLAPHR